MSTNEFDYAYADMGRYILQNGYQRENRTGIDTTSTFGYQISIDLRQYFPLLTLKKTNFHSIMHELSWFLKGYTNVHYLTDRAVHIWDEWAREDGEMGLIYGHQWRNWNYEFDQLKALLEGLKENPDSRRHILTAWNPQDIGECNLPPCHIMCQFNLREKHLACHMYQRSADYFLGVPFNIASYALLVHLICSQLGLFPDKLVISYGDLHIYQNHKEQVAQMLCLTPKDPPRISVRGLADLIYFSPNDVELIDYDPHPYLPGDVAI